MKYNNIIVICILLMGSPLFCANHSIGYIEKSYVGNKGEMNIKSICIDDQQTIKLATLCNFIRDRDPKDVNSLNVYKKDLLDLPVAQIVLDGLIRSNSFDNPEDAECLFRKYVFPYNKDQVYCASTLMLIGSTYRCNKNYEKSIELNMESLGMAVNLGAIANLVFAYERIGDVRAMGYWFAQNKKRAFSNHNFCPNAFENVCDFVNKLPGQKTKFEDDIACILQNEEHGLYD